MDLRVGRIIWATVPDRNGHPKDRPLIILTAGSSLICCAVTTKDRSPRPATYVRLSWDKAGRSSTRLKSCCYAVTDWIVEIQAGAIRREGGIVGVSVLANIMAKIEEL
jgi:orotate phosphoribosyltransferase-like protein